jgi:hypothetical protein
MQREEVAGHEHRTETFPMLVSCEGSQFKKGSFQAFLKIESAEAVQVKGLASLLCSAT